MEDATSIKSGSTTATNGTKRKRSSEPKFYAVRNGHKPGVYYTWADCLEQVKGFKKAMFKSFPSLTDAERFVAGEEPSGGSSPVAKYYAVKSGRLPGIYTDWPAAQDQITGWQKPKHRCFSTRAEAQRFLDGGDDGNAGSEVLDPLATTDSGSFFTSQAPELTNAKEPSIAESHVPNKKVKKSAKGPKAVKADEPTYMEADFAAGTGPLPPGAEDGFDPNIFLDFMSGNVVYKTPEQRQATMIAPGSGAQTGPIRVYTDGSSLGNGKTGALAGVGVYFGPGDKRNISDPLPGPRQTNQRAELTAISRALDLLPRNRDAIIVSDSKYAIDCCTSWCHNWRRNGWKTSAGKTVENKDLVENILGKIEERAKLNQRSGGSRGGVSTEFEWVKGHSGEKGNDEADKLSVAGARKAVAAAAAGGAGYT